MTQMMLDMRAPAEWARRIVGSAIVVGGAAELVAQALHAIASAAGG
ncbi:MULTISPECIES: hypothetical protein [Burkholderia]|uniref:Uncharacterized protein n=1 Tax=Burkholderia cepacia GG4 TaxID=1009846 RepID=A0A9W3K1G0_BURCE|nr:MULTISPECIES: hypothetical protein [Burkholderia]AFQ49197.1 hypothetical protein GEM_2799 [Burkholderia cepacia GG4]